MRISTGVAAIDQLDLECVIQKMMKVDTFPSPYRGWDEDFARKVSELYKSFLFLIYKYRCTKIPLVPTREIDEFWHTHILFTKKYFEDCHNIFGEYIHHNPAEDDSGNGTGIDAFEYTRFLISKEFPELADK